jgi:penicillin-binding protein 1A
MGSRPGYPTPFDVRRPLVVLAVLVALIAPVLATLWISTPDVSDAQDRVAADTQARGVVLLQPNQVPDMLAKAVVAVEDERFYSHHGVDTIGLARAVLYDSANLCLCEGGSTITEQLVKELYLNGSDRGYNKIVDLVLALKVEGILNKQQIMADYLSDIPTGLNRYGVTEAACYYFHSPLPKLTIGQYALLAGVFQAPSIYDPTVNPDAARSRRADVLANMVSNNFITQAQADAAANEPVVTVSPDGSPGC